MRYPVLLAVTLALSPVGCNEDSSPTAGTPLSVALVTRDNIQAGTITVSNSEGTLRLEIDALDAWTLEKVRVAAGTSLAHIPQTKQGQPLTEQFPLRNKQDSVSHVSFCVPLFADPGTELFFAVYADVRQKPKGDEKDCGMEPAWGVGTPFPKKPDAMYFTYIVQASAPPSLAGMYRTHTQDQWGGLVSALDAPAYLAANFDFAFLTDATIGLSSGFRATFSTAEVVSTFLPQVGEAVALVHNWTDPVNIKNSLAGETLALVLNVRFDDYDGTFSAGETRLGDLLVADPTSLCFNLTVRKVLATAHQVLAGVPNPLGLTAAQIHECVLRINLNFEDGAVDLGYLGLPPE